MYEAVPFEEEQEALLDELAQVIRQLGPEPFLINPLVEPTSRFFPDRWTADEVGAERMVSRLLRSVKLNQHVEVQLFSGNKVVELDSDLHGLSSVSKRGPQIIAASESRDRAIIGVDERCLDDVEHLAGVLSREVARLYLRAKGSRPDHDVLERWVDFVAIYLGFGVLTVNASHRLRTSGGLHLSVMTTTRLGVLTPQEQSFLLAAQVVARSCDNTTVRALKSLLEKNQAVSFAIAVEKLRTSAGLAPASSHQRSRKAESGALRVAQRLNLPAGIEFKPRCHFPESGAPLHPGSACRHRAFEPAKPDSALQSEVLAISRRVRSSRQTLRTTGEPVFRLLRRRTLPYGSVGALFGFFAGIFESLRFHHAYAMLAVPLAGMLLGRTVCQYDCSDGTCEHLLGEEALICSGCGGMVIGTIQHSRERFELEERWRSTRRKDSQ
jgi:hypothetical protein